MREPISQQVYFSCRMLVSLPCIHVRGFLIDFLQVRMCMTKDRENTRVECLNERRDHYIERCLLICKSNTENNTKMTCRSQNKSVSITYLFNSEAVKRSILSACLSLTVLSVCSNTVSQTRIKSPEAVSSFTIQLKPVSHAARIS